MLVRYRSASKPDLPHVGVCNVDSCAATATTTPATTITTAQANDSAHETTTGDSGPTRIVAPAVEAPSPPLSPPPAAAASVVTVPVVVVADTNDVEHERRASESRHHKPRRESHHRHKHGHEKSGESSADSDCSRKSTEATTPTIITRTPSPDYCYEVDKIPQMLSEHTQSNDESRASPTFLAVPTPRTPSSTPILSSSPRSPRTPPSSTTPTSTLSPAHSPLLSPKMTLLTVPSIVIQCSPPTDSTFVAAATPRLESMTNSATVKIGIAMAEGIFANLPTRAIMVQSGQQRTNSTSGGVVSVTFNDPFPSSPKVFAWLFGYREQAPLNTVPSSKIAASQTGFTAAVEGNFEMCWVAFVTPTTAPALKEAIRLILASPRGLTKPLGEKIDASIKDGTINAKADDGQTLLHAAAYAGNRDLVGDLLKRGADIDPKDDLDMTPMLAAISQGHFTVAEFLIKKGANMLQQTTRKQTALHFLAKTFKSDSTSTALLHTLLSAGIDVNAQSDAGDTALMNSCTISGVRLDFINSLMLADANPYIKNKYGESPILKAQAGGTPELLEVLSSYSGPGEPESEETKPELQRLPTSASTLSTLVPLDLVWNIFRKIDTAALFQSGRFRAQYYRHHIDFITPYHALPHVSVWSLSGTQSRISTKKIVPSFTGFDVDLEGVPCGSPLSWIATDTHAKKPKQLCPFSRRLGLDHSKSIAKMSERKSRTYNASPISDDGLARTSSPSKLPPVLSPPQFSLPLLPPSPSLVITPPILTFGGTEPYDIDKEVTDTLVVKNSGTTMLISFVIPSDDRYTLTIDPPQSVVSKGKDTEFQVKLVVSCTTKIDAQFGLIAADYKTGVFSHRKTLSDTEATFCHSIKFTVTTCLSTQLDYTDLLFEDKIGEGSFAAVWRGSWRHTPVAIKLLKDQNPTETTFAEFRREIKLLTQLRHTHVVNFIGAVTIPRKLCIITEYMALGNLSSVLKKNKDLAWIIKLKIAKDIALAMSFLHANNMVHRDLKPDNILMVSINKHAVLTCKVSDFGTSRTVSARGMTSASPALTAASARQMTVLIGTPIYMAPEVLSGTNEYGVETDVFSYGVMLWQILTEMQPYQSLKDFYSFVIAGNREEIPATAPPEYAQLIVDCWDQKPSERPSFLTVISVLEELIDAC
ncbi:tyrosine protein kinase [Pelomyxa schiedti]|nr:tyrosine protein kinase [Pelomyxa schiedti]